MSEEVRGVSTGYLLFPWSLSGRRLKQEIVDMSSAGTDTTKPSISSTLGENSIWRIMSTCACMEREGKRDRGREGCERLANYTHAVDILPVHYLGCENDFDFEEWVYAGLAIAIDGPSQFLERPLHVESQCLFHHMVHLLHVHHPMFLHILVPYKHLVVKEQYDRE